MVFSEAAREVRCKSTAQTRHTLEPGSILFGASQFKGAVMKRIKRFIEDESGMETLEYAVIAGLIAVVAVAVYASSGQWSTNLLNRLLNATNAT
jgi:Flp pilus assembly pilin Flp